MSELPEEFPDVLSFDEQALNPARAKHADKTTDATSVFFFIVFPFKKGSLLWQIVSGRTLFCVNNKMFALI